jgi:DNA repair ATPase RecN
MAEKINPLAATQTTAIAKTKDAMSTLKEALEKIDSLRSNLSTFQRTNNGSLLEDALETIEELHDDIEEILEDLEADEDD